MGYASRSGRASTSPSNPRAFAVCDRCAIWYNHDQLRFQYDWAGASLINKRLLVCTTCYDEPQEQLRAIVIPADPVPIQNPRPERFLDAETNYRTTSGQDTVNAATGIPVPGTTRRITQADDFRVTQQTGEPPGGLNVAPGTDPIVPDAAGGNDPGLPYQNVDVPLTGPLYSENYVVWYNSSGSPISWVNDFGDVVEWSPG